MGSPFWSLRPRAGEAPGWAGGPAGRAHVIVVGNEKGGAGKSTIAVLLATALQYRGARVAMIDVDLRQQSLSHFLGNRRRWLAASGVSAPVPVEYKLTDDPDALAHGDPARAVALFEQAVGMAMAAADIVIVDTPGFDTAASRSAHMQADLLVTPMNDSFVDFDVLGAVDPLTLKVTRPGHYARAVGGARRARGAYGRKLDWIVVRNRLAPPEAENRERLDAVLAALAGQVGFRHGPGLREREIFRELFPFGLTLADLAPGVRPAKIAVQREMVRQEVEDLVGALDLDQALFASSRSHVPVDIQLRAAG